MTGPLSDYRVIELTSTVSGPMAAMMLADQGADVIKIEPPLMGDLARFMGSSRNGMAAMFSVLNRNKRSLVLDLKNDADMAIFQRLVPTADVLIENYRPGIARKLGIDYDSMKRLKPDLIYVSISGYGQTGPYVNRKVYDPLIQATSGMAAQQISGRPANVRTIMFDKVTAITAAQVVTAALLHREKSGEGQYLPISMLRSALYYLWPDTMWSSTLQETDVQHMGELADYFQIYKTADGYISIILVGDNDFISFCQLLNSELHLDPRFQSFPDRIMHRDQFQAEIDKLLSNRDTDWLCNALDEHGIPVARVNDQTQIALDPQVIHDNSLVETEHPVAGRMRYPNTPFQLAGQDPLPRRHAPLLGEHNRELLTELQVDSSEIARLEERDRTNREMLANITLHSAR
jgi:crotonobetainyl-CoA:carnitine CoA-transferase CaiB-like acyl-CoA transferase